MQANLFGEQDFAKLTNNPDCSWINTPLPSLDSTIMAQLKEKDLEKYFFKVYLGCWCSDSKHLVPAFEAIRTELAIPRTRIQYISLNEDKESPSRSEKTDSVAYVPTFIVYDGDKEIGRIVEVARPNLETVLLGLF